MSRSASCLSVVGLALASIVCAEEYRVVEVSEGVEDWVMNPATGQVFASLSEGNQVIEFDAQGQEVRRLKVGMSPKELLLKRDMLIVGCTKSPALHIVDTKSGQARGEITLNGKGPSALFCSDVDNGLVYCVCNTGNSWWDGEVFQCDIKAMKVLKKIKVQGWGQSHVMHVAMSRDGKWIVPDARGVSSPSGADLMKVNEAEGTFTQVRDYHDSFGQISADPSNRYWTFGNLLYTLDIAKRVRAFAGSPVAIHPDVDLVVSKTSNGIAIERFSDASPLSSIAFNVRPIEPKDSGSRENSGLPLDPTVQIDAAHQQVFVGTKNHGFWVDLSPIVKQTSELMIVRAPSEVSTLVGSDLQVPLAITGDKSKSQLVIANGPNTAKIKDGLLTWRPQAENVGFTTFQLELKSTVDQRILDSLEMTVEVTLPKVELGFVGRAMELSPEGRFLVVWGSAPGQENRHPMHTGPDDVAIVDIQDQKIIAQKSLPQGIRCATIDEKYVYISPNSGNLFYRLNFKLEESQRMFTQSTPSQLIRMATDRLITVSDQPQIFDIVQMKPVANSELGSFNSRSGIRVLRRGEIQIGNRVVNQKTGQTVRTIGFANLPSMVSNEQIFRYQQMTDPNAATAAAWGRRLTANSLATSTGSNVVAWQGQRLGTLSARWPMAILVSKSQQQSTISTMLEFADLIDGTIALTSTIDVRPNGQDSHSLDHNAQNRLIVHDEHVLFLDGKRILHATIPVKMAEALPVPTHFAPLPIESIDADQPAKIKTPTVGQLKGVTFSLLSEFEGLKVDAASGELTIDTPFLWAQFVKHVSQNSPMDSFGRQRGQPESALDPSENAKQYKLLVGKDLPAEKMAVQIPIALSLQCEDGQSDSTQFSVVVTGSRKLLEAAIAAKKAEVAQQVAAAQEAQRKVAEEQAALRAAQAKAKTSSPGADERLEALETRMRRLEAAIDSILKSLDENKSK